MFALVALVLTQSCVPLTACDAHVAEQVVFDELVQFYGEYSSDGAAVSAIFLNGLKVGGPIVPTFDGNSIRLRGNRSPEDSAADVIVESRNYRTAGGALSALCGDTNHTQFFALTHKGDLILMPCPNADGTEAADAFRHGSLVDQSGKSGHQTVTALPGYNVGIAGRAAENHTNTLLDGGCNIDDADGGCHASFTALHGELAVYATEPRPFGGWLQEWLNPVTDGTDPKRAFVDVWGGFGQRHMMIRAQFPKCPADVEATTPQTQTYVNGALESTLLYAFDEREWYFCDGTDWQPMRVGEQSFMASTAGRALAPFAVALVVALLFARRRAA